MTLPLNSLTFKSKFQLFKFSHLLEVVVIRRRKIAGIFKNFWPCLKIFFVTLSLKARRNNRNSPYNGPIKNFFFRTLTFKQHWNSTRFKIKPPKNSHSYVPLSWLPHCCPGCCCRPCSYLTSLQLSSLLLLASLLLSSLMLLTCLCSCRPSCYWCLCCCRPYCYLRVSALVVPPVTGVSAVVVPTVTGVSAVVVLDVTYVSLLLSS